MSSGKIYIFVISILLLNTQINGSWTGILDYIWPNRNVRLFDTEVQNLPAVPYEIYERDEKFIIEASKLLGNKLSDLDICQQRIILLLKSSCNTLNDEEVGKMSVMLLNCQLWSEGLERFECTGGMSLKDCTSNMKPETLDRYNLMQSRAKTVCLIIRQDQFRGLAEMTVNRLVSSAHENINLMADLKKNHHVLQKTTLTSIDEISANNLKLLEQQQELLQITDTHRINAAFNLKDIMRGKNIIKTGYVEMLAFITGLKSQIKDGLSDMENQSHRARNVYNDLMTEITDLQGTAENISDRLDEASYKILDQSKKTKSQFKDTIEQLNEVNDIVLNLAEIIKDFRDDYTEKVTWLCQQLGGNEEHIIKNTMVTAIYLGYLLIGMLCLVFVNADTSSRVLFLLAVSLNFVAVLYDFVQLDLQTLTETISILLASKCFYTLSQKYDWKQFLAFGNGSKSIMVKLGSAPNTINHNNFRTIRNETMRTTTTASSQSKNNNNDNPSCDNGYESARNRRYLNERRSITPAYYSQTNIEEERLSDRSRSSTPHTNNNSSISLTGKRCKALTARGAQCQLTTVSSSTEFCRIHERSSTQR